MENKIKIFENKNVRTAWNEEEEDWYFSVVDIVSILADSKDYQTARKYWNKLKQRLSEEGSELVTNCHQLKLPAADGKNRCFARIPCCRSPDNSGGAADARRHSALPAAPPAPASGWCLGWPCAHIPRDRTSGTGTGCGSAPRICRTAGTAH